MTDATLIVAMALLALAVLVVEAVWMWRRATAPARSTWLPSVLAGAALLLAVITAALGLRWPVVAGCLAAAGVAHVAELLGRR